MNEKLKRDILNSIADKNLTLFCGAGVSIASPSNLPNARNLVSELLTGLLIKKFTPSQFINLRPEVVFQRVIEYGEKKFIAQLNKILDTRFFNQNHIFAAYLLSHKLNIITTNFDTLIESAANYLNIRFSKSLNRPQRQPTIFKIHGCLEDKPSLIYSINQVNLGLALWKQNFLTELLKDKNLLVLGYSGLDQLDILPVLKKAQYKKIFWINHTDTNVKYSPNNWVRQLPRLTYLNLNTNILISNLLINLKPKKSIPIGLNSYESTLTYLELLEHQNRYPEILRHIKNSPHKNNLRVRIFELISAGSSIKRVKNYKDLRESLSNDVFANPSAAQGGLLTFMGDAANKPKRWKTIEEIFDRELKLKNKNYYLVESILGYIAWLAHQNRFEKAHRYLEKVEPIIKQQGFVLLEARYGIAQGQILRREHEQGKIAKKEISELNRRIDRSIFLVGEEIFNDSYFYHRAIIVKAFVLMLDNQTKEAKKLLTKAIHYFKDISVHNCIDALDTYSLTLLKEKNKHLALKYINWAIDLNRHSKRTYYLGNLLRKKAMLIVGKQPEPAKRLLQESKDLLEREYLFAEATISFNLLNKL